MRSFPGGMVAALLTACGGHGTPSIDASIADASIADASIADASIPDASIADASIADASIADASIADASIADAGGSSLFTFVKKVQVNPVGNLWQGSFARVGYVPQKDRIDVAFNAGLTQPEAGCTTNGFAYREYTTDMVETPNLGVVSCHAKVDSAGVFEGPNYYLAAMEIPSDHNGVDGWELVKFDTGNWATLVDVFFPVTSGDSVGDPMVAFANGQIDVSSTYSGADAGMPNHATHHELFTPDFQFITRKILSQTPNINFSSLLAVGGNINFITSTDAIGDLIVMRLDPAWNYQNTITLKPHAASPEGAAFDGKRFYVSYLDVPCSTGPCRYNNVRLAAFDTDWNLVDDIPVTTYVPADNINPNRPSLALHNGRIYVVWDQCDPGCMDNPKTDPIHVYATVYDVRP